MTDRLAPDEALLRILEERAAAWAGEAGRMLLDRYGTRLEVEFKSKDERDPVTAADRDAEALLRTAIGREFPGHGIVGEEGEDQAQQESEFVWVLDPLDGTTNFINGLPLFAVSVGVLHEGRPVAGAIFTATSHRGGPGVYSARSRGGATFRPLPGPPMAGLSSESRQGDLPAAGRDERLTLPVQPETRPNRLSGQPGNFAARRGVGPALRRRQGETRVLGSIAVELAYVAAGTLQYGIFGAPRLWDVAAGVLVVQEAGGLVLERSPGSGTWLPLYRFTAPPAQKPDDAVIGVGGLRRWRSGVVAGSPEVAGFVADNLPGRRPNPMLRLLGRMARWARGRGW